MSFSTKAELTLQSSSGPQIVQNRQRARRPLGRRPGSQATPIDTRSTGAKHVPTASKRPKGFVKRPKGFVGLSLNSVFENKKSSDACLKA